MQDEEDALDSDGGSSIESDGRWKSKESTTKRSGNLEDFMVIDDDEVDQLLGPEDEDYRDMSAPDLSLDHPEDDSLLLDQDGSHTQDMPITNKREDQTSDTQNLDDVISATDGCSRSDGESLGDSLKTEVKRDSVDEDSTETDVVDLFAEESGEEDEDGDGRSHSSRFKSERKMVSVNRGYTRTESVPGAASDVRSQRNGDHRGDHSRPMPLPNGRNYLPGKRPRQPSGDGNMRSYPHHRPPRGHRNYPPNRRPYPRRYSGSPPPPPFRRSPPPYRRPRSPYRRSPPHHRPWSPYHYYPPPPPPPPHLSGHPPPLRIARPLIPPMPERRGPPPSTHRHPPFVDREPAPPLMPPRRPDPFYDRKYEGYPDDRERAPPLLMPQVRPQRHYDGLYEGYPDDGERAPCPLMPPARPQRQYDETYVGYPDNDFKRNYNGYNYPSRNERARFDPPPEQQPPGDDFMPIKVEPQEQLGPREILMPNRPVPVVANPQPVLQSLQSRPPPVAQPVSLIGREHARKQPTLQSNSQVVSAPTNMPPNEFNFNLAAAKQRVEAMQSTGFMGNKGNPFLKLQHQAAEPKTVVVKPVVRQQEPPPPPPPPQEAPQPLLKPACLPRLPDTSNQAQSRLQQLLTTVPAQRLNRQISLDTAQKRTSPPVRRVERHSSVGSMVNEKSRLFSPVRPLMEIKTLPVLPVHSLARTVDKASPDIQPIQLVARTVTESTNHIAMSTVQAGNQTAINVANKAVTQKRNPGTTMAQKSKATLVVSDLSAGTSSHQLRVLFSEVGTIKNLRILPGQNKAVVTFTDPRDALGCRRKFHRGVIDGTHINVSFV